MKKFISKALFSITALSFVLSLNVASAATIKFDSKNSERLFTNIETSFLYDTDLVNKLPSTGGIKQIGSLNFAPSNSIEKFKIDSNSGSEVTATSSNFLYRTNLSKSSFMIVRKENVQSNEVRIQKSVDPIKFVQQDSLRIAKQLGISSQEIGVVEAKKLMREKMDAKTNKISSKETIGYKAFFTREINGVPVLDSSLVVSYDLKGNIIKISGQWPSIVSSGNTLTTSLSHEDVATKVANTLNKGNSTNYTGNIAVRYGYDSIYQKDGKIQLSLKAVAFMSATAEEGGSKTKEVRVDLN